MSNEAEKMNIKSALKYQLADGRVSIPVFYLVIFCLMALIPISASGMGPEDSMSIGGFEIATIIFLFVVGLNSFRETFRMMVQNGVSRKTMFVSFLLLTLVLSVGMSCINEVLLWIGKAFTAGKGNITFQSVFEQMYAPRYMGNPDSIQMIAEGLLFTILACAATMMLGYFITIMYYRLNKVGKIAVSVGVPAILIIGLPIFDAVVTGGIIYRALGQLTLFAMGILSGYNPYYAMVSALIAFAVLASLSWMLARRAVVKD